MDSFVIRAANAGGVMTSYEQEKFRNVVKLYDRYLERAEQSARTAENAQEAAQTGETVISPSGGETMQTEGAAEAVEGNESPAEYLARMGELFDAGEITEEDYEAAQDLAAEMESTGRSFERSTVERDEGPRGKIGEMADRIRGKYSLRKNKAGRLIRRSLHGRRASSRSLPCSGTRTYSSEKQT